MSSSEQPATHGDFDITDVDGIDTLIEDVAQTETVEDWVNIFDNHLASVKNFGNTKVHKHTALWNMNSATDCPNAETTEDDQSETGLCQVPFEECYARKREVRYENKQEALDFRRKQQFVWDCLDADTFVAVFRRLVDRKVRAPQSDVEQRSDVDLRLSEAGDFRHDADVEKADAIAEQLAEDGITTYTYSASHKLEA